MEDFKTIQLKVNGLTGNIVLNRPEVHNAFNAEMISEIRQAMILLIRNSKVRVIVIRANGKSFSSGADLNYMRQQAGMNQKENIEDSQKLGRLFFEIYSAEKPVITISHGHIAGGANGIIAASDYAITSNDSVFRFSEVNLGLVPATIAPYIIDRIGRSRSMELLLTGKKFTGKDAEYFGLVNIAVETEELDSMLEKELKYFRRTAPEAIGKTKNLLLRLNNIELKENLIIPTAEIIAKARASAEGKEGIKAFFEKRNANWINEDI